VNSLKQIAGIYFSIKKLDDAKEWQKKVLNVDPKDPEAAYTVGVIDWTQAHENTLKALVPAGVTDDGEGNVKAPKKVMEDLKAENAPRALLEDLVGEVVVHLGLVVEHLEVGVLEQLRVLFAQALADGLLHARVVQFALAGRLPAISL
jgi:tetratricopeptide (TPR) repeat protein